jgi:methyl-accepting chemotaxis protein
MTRTFNNLSIRAKLAVMAACIVLLTASLGGYAYVLLDNNRQKIVELQQGVIEHESVVDDFKANTLQSMSDLNGLISTASNESDTAKIERLAKRSMANFDALIAGLPKLQTAAQGAGMTADEAKAFGELLPAYAKRGKEAADMATSDVATASGMLTGTRQRYEEMDKQLDKMVAAIDATKSSTFVTLKTSMDTGETIFLVSVAVIIVLSMGLAWLMALRISAPVQAMTDVLASLAEGNLHVTVPDDGRQDEVGKLATATATLRARLYAADQAKLDQVQLIVSTIGAGLGNLAKGDLTARISADLTGPFAKLKDDFNRAISQLEDTLKKVLNNTDAISTGASEISQAADDLSRRTEQQAASLEETAAALEEITATVKKTASNATEARSRATTAKAAAEDGGRVVSTAVNAMAGIEQSSKKITDIIGVIDEIAFQTNLLALNAGVEAARAGEAGKGFAVVASEVRALAQRSSDAAKQIKTLINASGEQVKSGVHYVGETGTALTRIVEEIVAINAFVTEMAQAAEQQSTGIQEVNAAVNQMDQVTQQNAAMVEESTAASRNLAHETAELAEIIGFFQVGGGATAKGRPAPLSRRSAA